MLLCLSLGHLALATGKLLHEIHPLVASSRAERSSRDDGSKECKKEKQFSGVVDDAAAGMRQMSHSNTPNGCQ